MSAAEAQSARKQDEWYRTGLNWLGQPVFRRTVWLKELSGAMPVFERRPFGTNPYLHTITRLPFAGDGDFVPVAAVGRAYQLIQHQQLGEWVTAAAAGANLPVDQIPVDIWRSELGERVRFRMKITDQQFTVEERYPLVLTAEFTNSVDRSCSLQMNMVWVRLICRNGLTQGKRHSLRKVHSGGEPWKRAGALLKEALTAPDHYLAGFRRWYETALDIEKLDEWGNRVLARQWTRQAANRVLSIAQTGFDVEFQGAPACPFVGSEVPGACAPIDNNYHLAQALSWVAGQRPTLEGQMEWMGMIPDLVDSFPR